MDDRDRALLDLVQEDFPLDSRPFAAVGKKLDMSEEEVMARLAILKRSGIIRRIGASFNSGKLGYVSTLVAARVDTDRLEEVAATINAHHGVTHNYQREGEYNLWFTLIARDEATKRLVLEDIGRTEGVREIHDLPATRLFKLRVRFDMGGG